MSATVNDIVKIMDSIAPRNLAEEWDNAGFLIGRGSNSVRLCHNKWLIFDEK